MIRYYKFVVIISALAVGACQQEAREGSRGSPSEVCTNLAEAYRFLEEEYANDHALQLRPRGNEPDAAALFEQRQLHRLIQAQITVDLMHGHDCELPVRPPLIRTFGPDAMGCVIDTDDSASDRSRCDRSEWEARWPLRRSPPETQSADEEGED